MIQCSRQLELWHPGRLWLCLLSAPRLEFFAPVRRLLMLSPGCFQRSLSLTTMCSKPLEHNRFRRPGNPTDAFRRRSMMPSCSSKLSRTCTPKQLMSSTCQRLNLRGHLSSVSGRFRVSWQWPRIASSCVLHVLCSGDPQNAWEHRREFLFVIKKCLLNWVCILHDDNLVSWDFPYKDRLSWPWIECMQILYPLAFYIILSQQNRNHGKNGVVE